MCWIKNLLDSRLVHAGMTYDSRTSGPPSPAGNWHHWYLRIFARFRFTNDSMALWELRGVFISPYLLKSYSVDIRMWAVANHGVGEALLEAVVNSSATGEEPYRAESGTLIANAI